MHKPLLDFAHRFENRCHPRYIEANPLRASMVEQAGLPFGAPQWVKRLAKRLDLDLTIRPRSRPRKQATQGKDNK